MPLITVEMLELIVFQMVVAVELTAFQTDDQFPEIELITLEMTD